MEQPEQKQRIIRNINALLNKLEVRPLRIVLLVVNMFARVPIEKV